MICSKKPKRNRFIIESEFDDSIIEGNEINPIHERILNRLERNIQGVKSLHPWDKDLIVRLVDNLEINAFADLAKSDIEIEGEYDIIGINIGCTLGLLRLFYHLLSNRETFPEIGNVELEIELPKIEVSELQGFRSNNLHLVSPMCPVRKAYATELAMMATEYIFFHELCHVKNGHCDFANGKRLHESQKITGNDLLPSPGLIISHTLEWDADCNAAILCMVAGVNLRELINNPSLHIPQVENEAISKIYADNKQLSQHIIFAAYSYYRMFASSWSHDVRYKYDHPSETVRMWWIIEVLHQLFVEREHEYGFTGTEFSVVSKQAIGDIEKYFKITFKDVAVESVYSGLQEYVRNRSYFNELEVCWKEIRPILNMVKRAGNLAV